MKSYPPYGRIFTDAQEKEISSQYTNGKSMNQLARELKVSEKPIRNALRRTNTQKRTKSQAQLLFYKTPEGIKKINNRSKKIRKYYINDSFFSEPLTKDSAYVLGFWMADGSIEFDRNIIMFNQMERGILAQIKAKMNATYPIYKMNINKGYRLSIVSRKICEDIKNICPFNLKNKSLHAECPSIQKELNSHFIRGIYDGDGGLWLKKDNQFTLSITGTMKLNKAIQKILIENCNASKTKIIKISTFSQLYYTGNIQVPRILDWLYTDAKIYLKRKKNLYEKIKRQIKER